MKDSTKILMTSLGDGSKQTFDWFTIKNMMKGDTEQMEYELKTYGWMEVMLVGRIFKLEVVK